MKICILTQPLKSNFGGLLQAFSLQKVLLEAGFEVLTDEKGVKRKKQHISFIKDLIRPIYYFFKKPNVPTFYEEILHKNTAYFKYKHIKTTVFLENYGVKSKENIKDYGAFIVGSDQVWRPRYNAGQNLYFLDFTKNYKVKRIAYAASFGKDTLDEFSEETFNVAKDMLPLFDFISVREDSGVALCKEYFNVDATHVLDPTLLLDKEDYLNLIEGDDLNKREKSLMVYILDETKEKQSAISKIASVLGLSPYIISPYIKENPEDTDYINPSISAWLAGFRDADFVLTDSFHGVVFSIIFNKNFIAINNKDRGSARFDSLLKLFGLEDRIVSDLASLELESLQNIDYERVNNIIKINKKRSLDLLLGSLK